MPTKGVPARQQGLSKLVILLVILVLIVMGAGTALALYFTGVIGGNDTGVAEGEEPKKSTLPQKYLAFEPPLVVNFERNGRLGYLQVNMQMMVRGDEAFGKVLSHLPVLRDGMLMLLDDKTYEEVETRESKELLRQEALAEMNRILDEIGVEYDIEAVYFTGFVMQ